MADKIIFDKKVKIKKFYVLRSPFHLHLYRSLLFKKIMDGGQFLMEMPLQEVDRMRGQI